MLSGFAGSGLATNERDSQLAALMADALRRIDGRFSDLDRKVQENFTKAAAEIARMEHALRDTRATAAERFKAVHEHQQRTGEVRGFASAVQAEQFGRFVAAIYKRDSEALGELQRAGVTPGIGAQGGYALLDQIVTDIMRDVDEAGIFLRNCPPLSVSSLKGGSPKGTSGVQVYHPDYGVAASVSTPGFGRTNFELVRYVAAAEIDNWMLASELAISLAEYVRGEIAYALSLATDTEWFIGDGTSEYGRYTGLFKMTPTKSVVGDSGDDTFNEMIAKTTYYLAQMLGALPQWAHAAGPRWYMHPLVFFGYLGVRDSQGMPIANIYLAQNGLPFWLLGYPVQLVSIAPSVTAVSTCFALLAALQRSVRTYRHTKAVEFKMTDQLKWLEGITTVAADVPMDMKVRNSDGIVQLITAAS
jgi:HK97 family phage major capsid protein